MSKGDFNGAELIVCKFCGSELELYYSDIFEVVSTTHCKCKKQVKRIRGMKPLDYALNKIKLEVLNAKRSQSISKNKPSNERSKQRT